MAFKTSTRCAGTLAALGLVLLAGCAGTRPRDRSRPPRLAVVLVIDQMRADYLTRFADQYTGGLARLTRDGVVFTDAHQDQAITHTAPGHTAIATGVFPGRTGIVANAWWDRTAWRSVYAVEDTVAIAGIQGVPGSSPANLLRQTLGDWLKQQHLSSKVFSVALKDRAAIAMGGHHADAAFWFLDQLGYFVTASSYLDRYPDWVAAFNAARRVDSYFEAGWTRLLSEDSYSASREDAFPAEADGTNTTFPHRFSGEAPGPPYYSELRGTPFGDDLTFAFARELVRHENLGADHVPDLLFVSASAADGIGHAYGPYSQEVQDYYLRLDQMLADFLDFLDREVGSDEYIVVLTSDHGVLPMPEELQRRGVDARRIDPLEVIRPLLNQTQQQMGLDKIPTVYASGLYLDRRAFTHPDSTLPALRRALAVAFREQEEIEDAFTVDELADPDTPDRPYLTQYRRSFHPERSPDIMIRLKEHYLPIGRPTSTTHGTPYRYDTHVPLIFLDATMPAAQHAARVNVVDIAPTLAVLLHLLAPLDLDGQALPEVIRAPSPQPATVP